MTISAIPLVQAVVLPASVAAQYLAPANSRVVVRHVVFTNTTAGAITVTGYLIPSGGSVADSGKVLDAFSIAGHTAYVSSEYAGIVMAAGDTIQCFASSAASISMNASGILQTS